MEDFNELDPIEKEIQESKTIWLKHFFIPAEIVANPYTTLTDGYIFSLIHMLSRKKKGCYARNSFLASVLKISKQTLEQGLQRLIQYGFIFNNGKTNHLRRLWACEDYIKQNQNYLEQWYDDYSCYGKKVGSCYGKKVGTEERYSRIDTISKDIDRGFLENPVDSSSKYLPQRKRNLPLKKNISTSNSIIKKRKRTKIVPIKIESGLPDQYMEYWNSLKGVPKHLNPNSSIYQQTAQTIKKLAKGILFEKVQLDSEWLKQKRIPKAFLTNKWPDHNIKDILLRLSHLYLVGYWPDNKDWLKTTKLIDLLYNPRTQKSWALAVLLEEPKKIKEVHQKKQEEKICDQEKMYIDIFRSRMWNEHDYEFTEQEKLYIPKLIKIIRAWWLTWDDEIQSNYDADNSDHHNIFTDCADWCARKKDDWPDFRINFIQENGKLWKELIESFH